MPKRSNDFQKLVFLVKRHIAKNAEVTESKLLTDRLTRSEREVDICIEQWIGGHRVTISIECRDHQRKADVKWVDEMKGKHEHLPTNALVLVSRSGFSPNAKKAAESSGIETLVLEEVDSDTVRRLFGKLDSLWSKTFTLSPTKVVVRVQEIDDLPIEDVTAIPDNLIFKLDGTSLDTVKNLIETWLKSPQLVKEMAERGDESYKGFVAKWENPSDKDGNPLCLRKENPPVIRKIKFIRVLGKCEFTVSEFPLEHGILGNVRVSWGSGDFMEKDALLVASEDEAGEKKLSITTKGM